MPVLKFLGGLRRLVKGPQPVTAETVRSALRAAALPQEILFPDDELNRDIEVLVNGRNISFLSGLETALNADDQVTIFLHGVRGYPGG